MELSIQWREWWSCDHCDVMYAAITIIRVPLAPLESVLCRCGAKLDVRIYRIVDGEDCVTFIANVAACGLDAQSLDEKLQQYGAALIARSRDPEWAEEREHRELARAERAAFEKKQREQRELARAERVAFEKRQHEKMMDEYRDNLRRAFAAPPQRVSPLAQEFPEAVYDASAIEQEFLLRLHVA